jgi:hemerythrin HHE cation binding domain-containing protein
MTTQRPQDSDAARHGSGDADLTLMIAAHQAFSRDLASLARAAGSADLANPVRRQAVRNGWQVFKRQLYAHHRGEDQFIWPALSKRLSRSDGALSVLAAMEDEHARIDPLLAAVDAAFADPAHDRFADVIDALATTLTSHLAHEEADALPLIGIALTGAEWKAVGRRIARSNGLSAGTEFFAWMLDGAAPDRVAVVLAQLPLPLRLLYRAVWRPRYVKAGHW